MKTTTRLALLLPVLLLAACSTAKPEGELSGTVGQLYNKGMDELKAGKTRDAVHTFDELNRQYPYSGWATRAQMMTAYAQLENGDYDEAIVTAEQFIKYHPGHKDLAYMYYLKGLANYNRIRDVARDQGYTREALSAFQEVTNRFPDSLYARDAKLKLTLCRDHMAGKEMQVGRYYQQQGRYLAAINRFKEVVRDYQTTTQTPEALYRLTESYLALGVNDEAQRSAAILGYNYPGSEWYEKAYNLLEGKQLVAPGQSKSWAGKIYKGVSDLF
ncbi:MAG: outer membrane protein assembly factor BamD [Pseudomonadaceae bacterium]|nr:outer membrane protein assembly factor BamD [Pseudomonadaceae bacterium]